MPITPRVAWRCPQCGTANSDYVDAEPIPYYCAHCGHDVPTLKKLLYLAAAA